MLHDERNTHLSPSGRDEDPLIDEDDIRYPVLSIAVITQSIRKVETK